MPPLVSVIVTAYNHELYIAAAIQSVLAQTYKDYELIVVDDGSSDSTSARVAAFGHAVHLVGQENRGVAASRNTGVRHARGQLLAFLDGDDLWEPTKLTEQVAAARRRPRSGLVVADGVQFNGDTVLQQSLLPPQVANLVGDDDSESITLPCYERLLASNLIYTTSQVLVPRAVLDQVGPGDSTLPIASDWDLYLRIAESYDVTFLRQKLVRWRYLDTSASGPEQVRPLRWAKDHLAILAKHRRSAPLQYRRLIRTLQAQLLRETAERAYWYGRHGDTAWARRHLSALLRQNPTSLSAAGFLLALCLPRPLVHHGGRLFRATVKGLLLGRRPGRDSPPLS